MKLSPKETTLAYRCPHCGATVFSIVGIFALSGDMLKLRCSCGKSETVLTYTSDRKLRLSVPCIACPKPHYFTLGQNTFFSREEGVFRLPCSYTGIDVCFIGKQEAVMAAVEESNEALLKLLSDAGMEDIARMRGEEEEDDLRSENPLLDDVVQYTLRALESDEAIHCHCTEQGEKGAYAYRIHHGRVTVECEKCGAMAVHPMAGVNSADDFLALTELKLD
ncbi:MAG: hypothetical protein IJW46_07595 [Clostridia bacterium]|nr:hypothetical protein [Clostridia bacterium]